MRAEVRQAVLVFWVSSTWSMPSFVGVLREDVEDQGRAVQHLELQHALQVALLARGELMVDEHGVGAQLQGGRVHLLHLALAEEGGRHRRIAAAAPRSR